MTAYAAECCNYVKIILLLRVFEGKLCKEFHRLKPIGIVGNSQGSLAVEQSQQLRTGDGVLWPGYARVAVRVQMVCEVNHEVPPVPAREVRRIRPVSLQQSSAQLQFPWHTDRSLTEPVGNELFDSLLTTKRGQHITLTLAPSQRTECPGILLSRDILEEEPAGSLKYEIALE